jgi:xylan 1,4-beta-xylosidase
MFDPLKRFASILDRFPCYRDIPFFNDESDIVWDGNRGTAYKSWLNFRNTEYAPGFVCKMINTYCDKVQDAWKLNLVVVDSDNCHLPWERQTFSGNRSQLTPLAPYPCTDLIRKPMFNAFQLLGKLGVERYIQKSDDVEFGIKYGSLGTKLSFNQGYSIMLWNFEDGLVENVNPREIALALHNLEKGSYHLLHFAIDSKTSNAYRKWEEMGMPDSITKEQIALLRSNDGLELVDNKTVEIMGEGTYSLSQVLCMHSVHLFMFVKTILDRKQEVFLLSLEQEENSLGGKQVFLKWSYSSDPSFIGYNVYRQTDDGIPYLLDKGLSCSYYYDSSVREGISYSYSVSAMYADGIESPTSLKQTIAL